MTISVRIEPSLHAALRRAAAAEGVTVAEFARRAIAERLDRERRGTTKGELRHSFGKAASERGDLSVRYKEVLRSKLREKHSRR